MINFSRKSRRINWKENNMKCLQDKKMSLTWVSFHSRWLYISQVEKTGFTSLKAFVNIHYHIAPPRAVGWYFPASGERNSNQTRLISPQRKSWISWPSRLHMAGAYELARSQLFSEINWTGIENVYSSRVHGYNTNWV